MLWINPCRRCTLAAAVLKFRGKRVSCITMSHCEGGPRRHRGPPKRYRRLALVVFVIAFGFLVIPAISAERKTGLLRRMARRVAGRTKNIFPRFSVDVYARNLVAPRGVYGGRLWFLFCAHCVELALDISCICTEWLMAVGIQ